MSRVRHTGRRKRGRLCCMLPRGTAVGGCQPYWRPQSPLLSSTWHNGLSPSWEEHARENLFFRCPARRAGAGGMTMELLYPHCCGLDVHKSSITACVRIQEKSGKPRKIVRRFGAMTADLRTLANWLREQQVTHVAMESTGVYWKPVWNILEGQFTLIWANAQHVKNVPGRKTDTKDSEWLAELLQYGLLRSSFVPPQLIRDLRDLTRTRARF